MRNFRQDLENLEYDIRKRFYSIMEDKKEIILFDEDELENDSPDDYFERRNDTTGDVVEIFILKIVGEEIHTIDSDDNTNKKIITFMDLASIEDKINLIELIELN